jgi:hypothetical protein
MSRYCIFACIFGLVLYFGLPVLVAGEDAGNNDDDFGQNASIDPAKLKAAVEKGVAWLKAKQAADGSFAPDGAGQTQSYPEGYTALVALTLIKCGVPRTDPAVLKAFEYIKSKEFKSIYSVSCLVLALDAFYMQEPEPEVKKKEKEKEKEDLQTVIRDKEDETEKTKRSWAKADPKDLALLKKAIEWIISKQQTNVWRYPMDAGLPKPDNNPEDASNTQYAMLALNVGLRLNLVPDKRIFFKVIEYFLREQDQDGPAVEPPFRVPGADLDIKVLKKLRDELLKMTKKEFQKAKSKGEKFDSSTVVVDDPYPEFGAETITMKARGWSYEPRSVTPQNPVYHKTTGSMTTSGIAALMICKSAVEDMKEWEPLKKKTNQAIRDGCAWIANNWSVSTNPGYNLHYYYYMYGLERSGVLSLAVLFGSHNWYEEGANAILSHQNGDGSWRGDGNDGATADTCFALLFLKRATKPIVNLPEQPWTGEYIGGKGKK